MENDLGQRFPLQTMSPEEYAARNAARIMEFSLGRFRYRDPNLDSWLQRLQEILTDGKLVTACREQYLTADEMKRAIELDREEF
ncbi:MAG: hypothetical protein NT062_34820 [Proteobacteria bacterium]|nr:hypothetical protein [Pseudomonadota bacterium]